MYTGVKIHSEEENYYCCMCTRHTIRKCKKMAGQNKFNFFLLNDAYMIKEHKETRMKMPNMFPFEKRHFLTWIDLNPGIGRN
jgi:hypothetical protein